MGEQLDFAAMAARLMTPGASRQLLVRYRVLLPNDVPSEPWSLYWPPYLELARPGEPSVVRRLEYGPPVDLGDADGEFRFASD